MPVSAKSDPSTSSSYTYSCSCTWHHARSLGPFSLLCSYSSPLPTRNVFCLATSRGARRVSLPIPRSLALYANAPTWPSIPSHHIHPIRCLFACNTQSIPLTHSLYRTAAAFPQTLDLPYLTIIITTACLLTHALLVFFAITTRPGACIPLSSLGRALCPPFPLPVPFLPTKIHTLSRRSSSTSLRPGSSQLACTA